MRMSSRIRLALVLALALAAPARADTAATEAAWTRHVERAGTGDIDAVMQDFGEESVVMTPTEVIAGKAAIRAFFEAFLSDPDASISVNAWNAHGRVMVFNFTAAGRTFHDVALIEDGVIKVLATVDYASGEGEQ